MPRRVSLPGASELFRPTRPDTPPEPTAAPPARPDAEPADLAVPSARGTGRVRHEEKITVYVSSDELIALERARLTLRAEHGLAVDRGRLVREAVGAMLADLEAQGPDAELVRRLTGS